jgi:hypothetical protein
MLTSGTPGAANVSISSLRLGFAVDAHKVDENIVERSVGPDCCLEFAWFSDCNEPTSVDQRDAITELIDLVQVMGRHDHRSFKAATQVEYMIPDNLPCSRVEPDRRLIEEQHFRTMEKALRNLEAADHPT